MSEGIPEPKHLPAPRSASGKDAPNTPTFKRNRSAFAYMEGKPDTAAFAQCGTCALFLRGVKRCHWLGETEVDEDDSCVMYVQGAPNDDPNAKPTGKLTPATVGLYDGKVRCENCNAFDARDPNDLHCDLYVQLNRIFPNMWNLNRTVKAHACCNAWAPGKRNPKNFGPYGPIPDADDPKVGGIITQVKK